MHSRPFLDSYCAPVAGRDRIVGRFWLRLFSLLLLSPLLHASNAGEPGEILSFGAGARALAMGSAVTAIAQDATAAYWNPAGLAAVHQHELSVLRANLFGGATYDYVGYGGLRAGPGVFGGHVARLGVDGAQLRDANNQLNGSFGYSETAVGAGYGFVLPSLPTLGMGAAINMISRSLNDSTDRLMGVDFGSQYAVTPNIGLGLMLKNVLRMSQGDTSDKLPQKIRLGAGYSPIRGLLLSADLENFSQIAAGAEYSWKMAAIRGGVANGSPTFGLGLRWANMTIDYAMASSADLGASHRISFGFAFGKPKGLQSDYNPDLSATRLSEQAEDAIQKGYYAEAERFLRSARHVKPEDRDIQDRLERLQVVTPHVRSAVGWDRANKLARAGINDYLAGKNVDGLWRMTYAYSVDKGQAGLLRVIESISRITSYRISLYDPTSALTLTQQVLAQALSEFRSQHYDETVNLCQRVISLENTNTLAYKRMGSALYALHQFDAAIAAWQKARAYETDADSKEQLAQFIEMARGSAIGLPANVPGDSNQQDDGADLEDVMEQR